MVAVSKEPKSRVGLQSGGITVERFRSRDSVGICGFFADFGGCCTGNPHWTGSYWRIDYGKDKHEGVTLWKLDFNITCRRRALIGHARCLAAEEGCR